MKATTSKCKGPERSLFCLQASLSPRVLWPQWLHWKHPSGHGQGGAGVGGKHSLSRFRAPSQDWQVPFKCSLWMSVKQPLWVDFCTRTTFTHASKGVIELFLPTPFKTEHNNWITKQNGGFFLNYLNDRVVSPVVDLWIRVISFPSGSQVHTFLQLQWASLPFCSWSHHLLYSEARIGG